MEVGYKWIYRNKWLQVPPEKLPMNDGKVNFIYKIVLWKDLPIKVQLIFARKKPSSATS